MNWINYLLQTNLYLLCFYSLYKLAYGKETYFNLNRTYLVGFTLLSFFIPFWQSGIVHSWFITQQVSQQIYSSGLDEIIISATPITEKHTIFNFYDWLTFGYIMGVIYMTVVFCSELFNLQRFLNSKTREGIASSFFGIIKVDKRLPHLDVIIAHEKVHGQQQHTIDLILISIVKIICWFNPVVYLLNIEFKKIHEFIADNEAASHLGSKAAYAQILISNHFKTNSNSLSHNFFEKATVKTRLKMLSKKKSHKSAIFKYGMIAPAFIATLILASSFVPNKSEVNKTSEGQYKKTDSNPRIKNTFEKNDSNSLFLTTPSIRKKEKTAYDYDKIFTLVQQQPTFPGGPSKMYEYLGRQLKYPKTAVDSKIEGRVFVKFVVEKDGSIGDIDILKGIGHGCEDEAKRVIKSMPKWSPGKQDGIPVRVYFTMPIVFRLKENKSTNNVGGDKTQIENVNIIKGKAAENKYGDQATDGAAILELNKPKSIPYTKKESNTIPSISKAMFLVNGEKMTKKVFEAKGVNPSQIESINVVKGKDATIKYGSKGKNGVVEIKLK